jgi:hypothetical protein
MPASNPLRSGRATTTSRSTTPSESNSEDPTVAARRKLRDDLLNAKPTVVTQGGQIHSAKEAGAEPAIKVPEGKLAATVHWYEREPERHQAERDVMQTYFPWFREERLPDGRLSWVGALSAEHLRSGAIWHIRAIYEHNHPRNNTYGGSIKIFSEDPDLQRFAEMLGGIPHLLREPGTNRLYICTARPQDFQASTRQTGSGLGGLVQRLSGSTTSEWTSAASSIAWAAKWIGSFELWLANDITTAQFADHLI